ncbi:vacuolar protein sorting-associated protein-like protein 53 [Lepidopterella palustris CBS 459.81]|uniref:Vacuolar protein sorting-associated protein-like protein 53 n=1 Tax=Lepidopterella palustris CBS 459.81 TaxID=1314670 RepID=A0A8E2DYW4_9PEZI|nr:vacuolar protein sorting-associated protein-like protein 53 [Lepidopterella palustris CBS 459.81]
MSAATSASLDSAEYDPIDYLNAIFSHPTTLSSVSATSHALRNYQDDLDEDIAEFVSTQTASDADSVQRIQAAKSELADLFKKIENVRERAIQTEQTITDMTADIKRLDNTKRNLTLSMTALKRLQMFTTAYEQLRSLSKSRQYRECAQLLQAVIQLVGHFKSYRSIDQIATLSRNVADLQRELLEQVCEDFEVIFAKDEVAQRKAMLSEACLVMDALGDHARSRLINWYCNTQLREYRQVFRGNDEAGSLDNISRRYSWFNRMLKTYDSEHAAIFPPYWKVNEMLANAFCEGTRDDFKVILQKSMRRTDRQTLDVNLLLSCLQETLNFEHSLERRFASESRSSIDTMTSKDDRSHSFGQAISEAFEPYMSLWVDSQDKQLATLIPKYRQQPLRNVEEEFSFQAVIPSSTEMFHFYRLTLAQCAKLSTGNRLLELSRTFAKYLDQYGQQVLFHFLSERPGPQGPSVEDTVLILNTADYCYLTCNQLEEKIKGRIDEELRLKVDLQSQADAFMGIASAAVRTLVRKVEIECELSWREMRNTPWSKLESVGDQSTYVAELLRHVKGKSAEILKLLHKPQYARAFCDNLVDLMANTYIINVVQSKPISEVGAEQMLLDSYVLKQGFTELPTINGEPGMQPPASFVKRVNQCMAKVDPLLKTLQVRPSPPEALVQAYLIHIADRSDTNFRKILELKGIRKQEQASLVDLFAAFRAAPSNENLIQNSPLLTPLQITSAHASTSIASLSNATSMGTPSLAGGRFDPSTFGSAIMNAARDGVDRFGSPALGASSTTSPGGVFQPQQGEIHTGPAANLNENLKNIGKFFRRDVGSFGRFGRSTDDTRG